MHLTSFEVGKPEHVFQRMVLNSGRARDHGNPTIPANFAPFDGVSLSERWSRLKSFLIVG